MHYLIINLLLERLLAANADVNAVAAAAKHLSWTALQTATKESNLNIVEKLLVANIDVNDAAAKYGGRTALEGAVGGCHIKVAERLLIANADTNAAIYEGRTALQTAAKGGHTKIVESSLPQMPTLILKQLDLKAGRHCR
jgi:ankyrin repeat protein